MATTPRSRMPVTSANFGNWLRSQQITGNFSFSATVVPVPSASAIYVGGRALPKLPEIDFNMTDTTKGKQKYSTILVVREEFQELASKIAALSLGSAKPLLTDTYTPKAKLPTSSDASTKTRDSLPLRSHLVVPSTSEFLQAKSAELATASVVYLRQRLLRKQRLLLTGSASNEASGIEIRTSLPSNSGITSSRPILNIKSKIFRAPVKITTDSFSIPTFAGETKPKRKSTKFKRLIKKKMGLFKRLPACFSRLPTELRLTIWELSRPEPRVVKTVLSKKHDNVRSAATIPNLLHTCHESRVVALKWYRLSFGPRSYSVAHLRRQVSQRVYFDWSRDYLYVQCHQCRGSHSCDLITGDCGINQITHNERSLLERVIYEFSGESSDVMIRSLIWFKGVQDLKIVHWEKGLLFRQGAWLSELVEDEKIFPWQDGKSLMDYVQTSQFSNNIGNYGNTIRNLKSIENVALHPLNSLGDILRDAKINYLQNKH
ncbi:hypothetical protein PZA11_005630 [Diplocarpon coronariae]|nr:hypothetical protein JHW43_000014 [Diplocarpon mali]